MVYTVVDNTGRVAYRVGDSPYLVPPTHVIPGDPDHFYYAMKLLKAPLARADEFPCHGWFRIVVEARQPVVP